MMELCLKRAFVRASFGAPKHTEAEITTRLLRRRRRRHDVEGTANVDVATDASTLELESFVSPDPSQDIVS